ncbi:MAG: hypothetical protein IJV97_03795 [Alphaproteobacteria bacterium]|nr:hypothetical protein [Alphaproteobacteria bacterium]
MGTFFKYVFYVILLLVVYLVGKGIYEGSINENTTVGGVVEQVDAGGRQMVQDGADVVNDVKNNIN